MSLDEIVAQALFNCRVGFPSNGRIEPSGGRSCWLFHVEQAPSWKVGDRIGPMVCIRREEIPPFRNADGTDAPRLVDIWLSIKVGNRMALA